MEPNKKASRVREDKEVRKNKHIYTVISNRIPVFASKTASL
jgi:hypothetical protein